MSETEKERERENERKDHNMDVKRQMKNAYEGDILHSAPIDRGTLLFRSKVSINFEELKIGRKVSDSIRIQFSVDAIFSVR